MAWEMRIHRLIQAYLGHNGSTCKVTIDTEDGTVVRHDLADHPNGQRHEYVGTMEQILEQIIDEQRKKG